MPIAAYISWQLSEWVMDSEIVKTFLTFWGTRKFIKVFRRAIAADAEPEESNPHFHSCLWSVIILSTTRLLVLANGLFPSGFLTRNIHADAFLFPSMRVIYPAYVKLHNFIMLIICYVFCLFMFCWFTFVILSVIFVWIFTGIWRCDLCGIVSVLSYVKI
jgi:hypothetical protein